MTSLTCKFCGGDILLTGETHGICDSCGRAVTLPRIDDDKRTAMFNRGNRFRTVGDFDRAYTAYQHIIADDPNDAEAHWCMTLCRYGVEYVQDARTGDYKPTLSRMSFDPILEDPDYLAALSCSDSYTAGLYRQEAERIARIQERYMRISREEPPYDVFICFKAEDENRQRTKGSILGQNIYEALTQKGLNVFFSRITMEDKLSVEYEPYIFAALHSAKVMLVVGDKPEHLQARWVRNEWSRYLAMMERDSTKQIVPVFIDMWPDEFPQEIPMFQGQDMSKVGAMQDLVRGVLKLTGKLEMPVAAAAAAAPLQASADTMLRRVAQALDDSEYAEAIQLLNEVLNADPENGEAHFYMLLAEFKAKSLTALRKNCDVNWQANLYFKRALKYGSPKRVEELNAFLKMQDLEVRYQNAVKLESGHQAGDDALQSAAEIFRSLGDYRDSAQHMQACISRFQSERRKAAYDKEIDNLESVVQARIPKEYRKFESLRDSSNKLSARSVDHPVLYLISLGIFLFLFFAVREMQDENYIIVMVLAFWFSFLCSINVMHAGCLSIVIFLLPGIFGSAFMYAAFLELPDAYNIISIIMMALSILLLLYQAIVRLLTKSASSRLLAYVAKYITPVRDEVRREINAKYRNHQ